MTQQLVLWNVNFENCGCRLEIRGTEPIDGWLIKFPGGRVVHCLHGNRLSFDGDGTEDCPVLQIG